MNCAGPFLELGEPVVRAAIAAGCHYVDTSAEQMFVKGVFRRPHRRRRARRGDSRARDRPRHRSRRPACARHR
ncbi:hypothetical protein [Frankia symbiont of Coriaria ruscifolia]|uniref:hypothetical protein n=1 Tax=Protofrankia symbiont of Coriaria ruscifolia TaxID=1306542 RepID=UPI0010411AB2